MSYVSQREVYTTILSLLTEPDQIVSPRHLRPYLDCSPTAICQHFRQMELDGVLVRVSSGRYRVSAAAEILIPLCTETEDTTEAEETASAALQRLHSEYEQTISDLEDTFNEAVIQARLEFANRVLEVLR